MSPLEVEKEMSFFSYVLMFINRFIIWGFAMGMIFICSIIFLAIFGIYLLINQILYATNLTIFGLNMIVSPFAMAIKTLIDNINNAMNEIKKIFDMFG